MYLWDSNILRHYPEDHPVLKAHLQRVLLTEIALPSVVVAEVLRGRCESALKAPADRAARAHAQLLETHRLVQTFQVIVFDQHCAALLQQLQQKHKSHKRYPDLMIAATALALNHIVVTRNTRHFADLLPANRLANWIDDPPR